MFLPKILLICLTSLSVSLGLTAAVPGSLQAVNSRTTGESVKNGVVLRSCTVYGEEGTGSGSVFQHKGRILILTAAHVVDGNMRDKYSPKIDATGKITQVKLEPRPVTAKLICGRELACKVIWFSADWGKDGRQDLAVLEPPAFPSAVPAAEIYSGDLEVGEDCWYCGYGSGVPFNLEKSIVNQIDPQYVVCNGIGWYGHSGSGVYVLREGKYRLVGVVVLLAASGPRSPIKAERQLGKFLESLPNK